MEYPIRPMAVRPIVIQVERTKAAPILATTPFQDIRMITGTKSTRITERRLRHCVVKSERSKAAMAAEVLGKRVDIDKELI
jgi:hypothetical protein